MNKELVYNNIFNLINNGFFVDKYIELTTSFFDNSDDFFEDMNLEGIIDAIEIEEDNKLITDENSKKTTDDENYGHLENVSAGIFNAILIGSQLFDDEETIKKFVDTFSNGIDPYLLEVSLPQFGISTQDALERLKHGFAVHFTTTRISDEIIKNGKLVGAGKNAMFTEEENNIINYAENEQKKNNPDAEEKLDYLFRGWGTGVTSYGSTTNGFWMYHTPESLTFLFGDISKRSKNDSMKFVLDRISALKQEDKKIVLNTMSNIYDRLIGDEQNVCCLLIDRDAFEYEVDYYYDTGEPVGVERRPYSKNFNSLISNDSYVKGDIDVSNIRFIKIPTVLELERQKEQLQNNTSTHKL